MSKTFSFSRLNGRRHHRKQQMSSGHIHYYELVDLIHLYDTTKIILPICNTNHEFSTNMTHSTQIFITLRQTKSVLWMPLYAPEKIEFVSTSLLNIYKFEQTKWNNKSAMPSSGGAQKNELTHTQAKLLRQRTQGAQLVSTG
jgi:hypothetical protein